MPSLRELQLSFAEGLMNGAGAGISRHIRSRGLSGERRLQVYRNNVFESLTEALCAVYPVVGRLVGEDFFRYAAQRYIREHTSTSGNLHDFGAEFAGFIESFPGAAELVYLPDVARLEWLYHRVFHAADHAPLDMARLREIPVERHADLRFRLHPASCLLASEYPVLRIWQVNQEGYAGDATVDLAEGGVKLLVLRRDLEIEIHPLAAGEFALLAALSAGKSFADACEAALRAEPELDLSACLLRHIGLGVLVDCFLTAYGTGN